MADVNQAKHPVLHKTIVMVGMMGAGKTAVGKVVAGLLGVPFCDSDHEIETAANRTIAEIFARDGEPFFRDKERQVIDRLLQGAPCVLSTGGGAFLQEPNRRAITHHGVSLWLDANLALLWNRVRHKNTRPLLQTADPFATLSEIFAARVPVYAQADVAVKCAPDVSLEEMGARVVARLAQERPDVLEMRDG